MAASPPAAAGFVLAGRGARSPRSQSCGAGAGERGLGVEGARATAPLRCCTAAGGGPGAVLLSIGHFGLGEGSLFHMLLPIYVNKSAERETVLTAVSSAELFPLPLFSSSLPARGKAAIRGVSMPPSAGVGKRRRGGGSGGISGPGPSAAGSGPAAGLRTGPMAAGSRGGGRLATKRPGAGRVAGGGRSGGGSGGGSSPGSRWAGQAAARPLVGWHRAERPPATAER